MRKRILLIAMPIASPHHPNLGLSLLKAISDEEEVACEILYANLRYAEFIGIPDYKLVSDDRYFCALVGEWLFEHLVSDDKGPDHTLRYYSEVLAVDFREHMSVETLWRLIDVKQRSEAFLTHLLETTSFGQFDLIGFSCSFQQTQASLAMAKRLKKFLPSVPIIFGGANCEGQMGNALSRLYPFVDMVCQGEGENVFREILRRHKLEESFEGIPGLIVRTRSGELLLSPHRSTPLESLDDLPIPDFRDFLEQRRGLPSVSAAYRPVPLVETARGCWWGAKSHCRFCGLNGTTMAFRSKSPERAIREISHVVDTYGPEILAVDNIIDTKYFTSVLPALGRLSVRPIMHYEVKANLNEHQISVLASAGVKKIQPGIESLSSEVLSLMAKGCTLLQNVQTLKFAKYYGLRVEWGFLHGFPGELPEWYARMERIIPLLTHLPAPSAVTQVRADRFSPYFTNPDAYGVRLAPLRAYDFVFPFERNEICELAYHFQMDLPKKEDLDRYTRRCVDLVNRWSDNESAARLQWCRRDHQSIVVDERAGHREIVLNHAEDLILEHCWSITSKKALIDKCSTVANAEDILNGVDRLRDEGVILVDSHRTPIAGMASHVHEVSDRDPNRFILALVSSPTHTSTDMLSPRRVASEELNCA